jgi:hypothetical protein
MGIYHAVGFTEQIHRLSKKHYCKDEQWNKEDLSEREYKLESRKDGNIIASFRARALPGCCGVLVVYYLRPGVTKRGLFHQSAESIFKETLELIIQAAGKAKFGAVLLTQTLNSTGAKVLGEMLGCHIETFTNWKTKNKVSTYLFPTVHKATKPPVKGPTFNGE